MELVSDDPGLRRVEQALQGAELVALDTEAAGYHRYHDRVCLLQLSTRERTFVVDTLALRELDGLLPVLAADGVEVVVHDADYDLRLLARDFGLRVSHLFDTRIAAQFLGDTALGLGGLVEQYLGIRLEKKFQKADWARRPLPHDMLEYAAEDTRHLPALRDRLRAALIDRGRLGWAEEEFRLSERARWDASAPDPDAFMRLKGSRDLSPRELAVLRELHAWREDVARERDLATFRILGNEGLLNLARAAPRTRAELADVRGVPAGLVERRGADLLAAVRRGLDVPDAELPRRPRPPRRPPPDPDFEAMVERLRQVRDRAAERLGLDRGFLMPRAQLEAVARSAPTSGAQLLAVEDLRRWQVEALGDELLAEIDDQARASDTASAARNGDRRQ
jgi:ribonuclease D